MREAAYSVVATVPLGHNVEVLERKLIALRAEIDAILSLLASGTTAAPAPAIEAEPGMLALEAIAGEPSVADLTAPPEVSPEACLHADEVDRLEDDMPTHAIASHEQSDAASLAEAVEQSSDIEAPASDPVAPIDAVDRPEAAADATSHAVPGTAETETTASQAEMPVDVATATATPSNPTTSVDGMPSQPAPSVAAAPERAVDDLPASAAAEKVVSLQSHPRKHKMEPANASAPLRPRRRLAAKIAASIIALLTAATVLILAEEEAIGSAQSLPWMSPAPAPSQSGFSWPFFGARQAPDQDTAAAGESRSGPSRAVDEDALLSRYREVWPSGW
jgi:hypothetical protein